MELEWREVKFCDFCHTCKHEKVDDTKWEEPCNECLENPVQMHTNRPLKWEAKE